MLPFIIRDANQHSVSTNKIDNIIEKLFNLNTDKIDWKNIQSNEEFLYCNWINIFKEAFDKFEISYEISWNNLANIIFKNECNELIQSKFMKWNSSTPEPPLQMITEEGLIKVIKNKFQKVKPILTLIIYLQENKFTLFSNED